jgi:hypothetical protein
VAPRHFQDTRHSHTHSARGRRAAFGKLLAAQDQYNAVTLFDTTSPSWLRLCDEGRPPGCLWSDLNHADGSLEAGLWLSLDDYGLASVPVAAPAAKRRP